MRIVGIDLGTTNSLVGIIEKTGPRLFSGEDGKVLIPSVVHYASDGSVEVGIRAKEKRLSHPNNTVYSAKRYIGLGKKDIIESEFHSLDTSNSNDQLIRFQVMGKSYTPIEVSSLILKKLKALAESELKEKIQKAVITVPAYFNDAQRNATKLAGEMAGLEVLRIVNEPTAACLAYGLDKKAKGTVVVFDLGGGTFDISILKISDGVVQVLATNGNTALGGDDFDEVIASYLKNIIEKKLGNIPPLELSRLLVAAEELKRNLTKEESALFEIQFTTGFYSEKVSRKDLEPLLMAVLKKTELPSMRCMKDAEVDTEDISDVILVGGSTRLWLVTDYVKGLFKRLPISTLNPDEVVAIGAAVQANIMAGQTGDLLLLDVIPLSLGIETMGGVVTKLIHRNSTIPISASQQFTTYVDGQTAVSLHVLQGERELAADNRSLARFELKGVPPMPAGIPKLEVEFMVDVNGILNVRASELRTGTVTSIQVSPTYGLNDTEVEKMLMDSFENAEKDFEARFLIEARVEAESLLRAARKSIEMGKDLVSEDEVKKIHEALKALESSITSSDYKLIKNKIEELNQSTQLLAEKLMNKAVSSALKDRQL